MASLSQRPTYTRDQLAQYIVRLYNYSTEEAQSKLSELEQNAVHDPLGTLKELQQRHLAAIPFSNVVLHYSQHRTISLDPDTLFHKMIERNLGGYCMENTGLFSNVLRYFGYRFFTCGARVCKDVSGGKKTGEYTGFGHMILIVTINGKRYIVDVGFGPKGPTRPLLLEEGSTAIAISPSEMRLVKESISSNTDPNQKPWIFQTRMNPSDEWSAAYCFYDVEFLPQDFEVMNFNTSQNPKSIFVKSFICSIFMINPNGDDIMGVQMITGSVLKHVVDRKAEVLETLESEEDRVSALARYFNVQLQPMEVRGIRGLASEIQGSNNVA